jgi:Tfp pilus assembly ATPase PilU
MAPQLHARQAQQNIDEQLRIYAQVPNLDRDLALNLAGYLAGRILVQRSIAQSLTHGAHAT